MFLENIANMQRRKGWIEVVCGSMFSGKTEELIRRLKRAKIAQMRVEIFKPITDTRYHDEDIVSHNQNSIRSTPVNNSGEILLLAGDCDVIGLDEVQFFDENIIEVCNTCRNINHKNNGIGFVNGNSYLLSDFRLKHIT